ncbi:SH2 domain-containing protein 4B-like [Tubulanus polymorphus]|uniref:SH2 domain-containing protein 4B-like n=1 Tax=Tubulanus polymorphus TaxID=672921 RepID=UPI003DA4ECE3
MLQQILKDMYVDPEILVELSDEQKQILFCKIREEQLRRWKEWDSQESQRVKKPPVARKPGSKNVNFLHGADQKEWVWVMGEHQQDKSIEEILLDETKHKAHILAEQEAEELRKREEDEIKRKLLEEQERLERERQQKEEEIRRKEEEAALYQSLKEARLAAEKLEREKKKEEEERQKKLVKLRNKVEKELGHARRRESKRRSQIIEQRSSQIFSTFQDARAKFEKAAQESSKEIEIEWIKQEEKSKHAEEETRLFAKRAREEYRNSLHLKIQAVQAFQSGHSKAPELPPKSRVSLPPPSPFVKEFGKPPSREAVIKWFKEYELPKGAGRDTVTGDVAEWFHGIINRNEAESLLQKKPVGSYLVRVSEKIWGYAISFRSESRIKHFLIDASDGTYQFFGTNQSTHVSLAELMSYHKNNPISMIGQEFLHHPCGQSSDPPDYSDLIVGIESTDL